MTTDTTTTQRVGETASTAADEGRHVAGVAAEEAKGVASEAVDHARGIVDDAVQQARGTLDDQGRQQKDRLAATLGSFGDDLSRMAEGGSGLAAELAHEVSSRARTLSRHLDQRQPAELLDDVRRFARRRPGTFLLGALGAGVVVGRLVRGTKDAVEAAEATGTSSSQDPPRVTPGAPDTTGVAASSMPPSSTGYSSPPLGNGLGDGALSSPEGSSA